MSQQAEPATGDSYSTACEVWRVALARYIELARQGEGRAVLRQAAAALQEAALKKAWLARSAAGVEH